jgi:inosine-uridine nucleoside N-ribohydrolase
LKDKSFPKNVKKIVLMGGGIFTYNNKSKNIPKENEMKFDHEYQCHSCHNFRQDISAAEIVFSSDIQIYCVGHTGRI